MRTRDDWAKRPQHDIEDEIIASQYRVPLLITAGTRAEAEALARRIHGQSPLALGPFVCVPAAAFAHEPMAFTNQWGELVRRTRGGTLLVADIDALPPALHDAFHREMVASPSVRLVSSTTVSLHERVATQGFSDRLFYRLNYIHLVVGTN